MGIVLAAVDLSPVASDVLSCASRIASSLDLELVVLFVAAPSPDFVGYEAGPDSVRHNVSERLRAEHRQLEHLVAALDKGTVRARPLMVQGVAAKRIADHAARLGAEYIVLGSHGHGKLYDLLVGSVADGVLRSAKVPVVMVPARPKS